MVAGMAQLSFPQHRCAVFLVTLACLLGGALTDSNNVVSDSWIQVTTPLNPPSARESHSAVYVDINISMVIFGGRDAKKAYNDVSYYNVYTALWRAPITTMGPVPVPRYGHSAVVTPTNTMVVFGGRNQTNIFNDVAVLNLLTMAWVTVSVTGTPPSARAYHTAVVANNKMLVYGGTDDASFFSDVHCLDLDTLAWTLVAPTNGTAANRAYHSAVVSPQGVMIVFGGLDASDEGRSDLACFHTRTYAWWSCGPASSVRYGHTAVISPLQMMVVYGGKNSAGGVLGDVLDLDLNLFRWTSIVPSGAAIDSRAYHTAVATAFGSMIVFGGVDSAGTVDNEFGFYNLASTVLRNANDGAVLVVLITLLGTILISLCFAMDYMQEQSEIEKEEAIEKAKQEQLLLPRLPNLPKALHIPLGPRAQKFFDEFKTSLDPLQEPK